MIRFCTVCTVPIDDARMSRGSAYCSDYCMRKNNTERRDATRKERCESCKRKFRRRSAPPLESAPPRSHNNSYDVSPTLMVALKTLSEF